MLSGRKLILLITPFALTGLLTVGGDWLVPTSNGETPTQSAPDPLEQGFKHPLDSSHGRGGTGPGVTSRKRELPKILNG
jgi:hypothetical protein